jgi:hypothetical protein
MSAEKLAPCPLCGNECEHTILNSALGGGIACTVANCQYVVQQNVHAEICAALAHYREHKDRHDWYCADWTAKSV